MPRSHRAQYLLFCIALCLTAGATYLPAQDDENASADTTPAADTDESEAADASPNEPTEQVRSAREERREILQFGIDTQVLEVLEKLEEERDEALLDDAYATFKLTRNPEVKIAAIDLFETLEYYAPEEDVLDIVTSPEPVKDELLVRAVRYLSHERNDAVADELIQLVDDPGDAVARAAIQGIGKTGSRDHAETLLERFEDPRYDPERKAEIILALGEIRSKRSVDMLIDILDNPDEDMTHRRYACDALGKIGDPAALPAIQRALGSENAMLRAYAVSSIRHFEDESVVPALTQGLRDSFWRVRVSAAEALGEMAAEEALPILDFKARLDPEDNVQDAAIRAIAAIGTREAFDMIRTFFEDETFALPLRVTCAELLAEHRPAESLESFKHVVATEMERRESKLLERVGYYLSLTEEPALEPIFLRFLDSQDLVLTIYGIRGIERNGLTAHRERIESLTEEQHHRSIRRAAQAAIENL